MNPIWGKIVVEVPNEVRAYMSRVRVKICGITRVEDGIAAARAGADAIGLVFYSPSPRNVSPAMAEQIIRELPPFITKVGLFVDAADSEVRSVLGNVGLDMLQFHGNETGRYCEQFAKPWLKAIRMNPGVKLADMVDRFAGSSGLLLDSCVPGKAGGTGEVFDWNSLGGPLQKPVILAGGLNPGNVAEAIRTARPYAVDVSSGVESAPGLKDARKIADFINQVMVAL